jgi:hypothetical protein
MIIWKPYLVLEEPQLCFAVVSLTPQPSEHPPYFSLSLSSLCVAGIYYICIVALIDQLTGGPLETTANKCLALW